MRSLVKMAGLVVLVSAQIAAGDLAPDMQAKFVKLLASSAGSAGKISCTSPALLAELGKLGVANDASASVAWASSEAEVKALKAAGKLVICGKLDWLPSGGSIAVVEEGGKPQIYLHMGNIAASKAVVSDTVLRIGKRL